MGFYIEPIGLLNPICQALGIARGVVVPSNKPNGIEKNLHDYLST